jgi:hypothetical protein
VFPFEFAKKILRKLKEKNVVCTTYSSLLKESSWGSRFRYLDEFISVYGKGFGISGPFRSMVGLYLARSKSRLGKSKSFMNSFSQKNGETTVLLQHDADLFPERTLQMMALEQEHGLLSSSYFFRVHADLVKYELDINSMKQFESQGFEIGYHQNAYERSGYRLDKAMELVREDVHFFAEKFNLRSFVPHGGTPGPDGKNNRMLPHSGPLKQLLWAYNGNCMLKHYSWSDGGILKNCPCNPLDFIDQIMPGTRAMILMHPQYYGQNLRSDWKKLPISKCEWWKKLWGIS